MSFIRLGKLEINLDELRAFIVKAKKHCYAGNGEEERLADGSKRLVFQEGNFWYEDNYDGYYQAPGRELVKWQREDGKRIWQMACSGGMLPQYWNMAQETFAFLKKALMQISPYEPFRGPEQMFYSTPLSYCAQTTDSRGPYIGGELLFGENFTRFSGVEWINFRATEIFRQNYIGGLVIPK